MNTTERRVVRPAVVLLGLLALALNLRSALAGYPPLLETARSALGISAGAAGFVQASSVLMMAAGSFIGSGLGARFGRERALAASVMLVAIGSLLRGVPALAPLVGGSMLVGLGIGLAGVLLAGVVKEHLAERAGAATGGYVVSMMVGSTASSALAVPLAGLLGGWSFSLAVWAVPAVIAVGLWIPVARRVPGSAVPAPRALPWRDPFARQAACFIGGNALLFNGWLTWLAPYYAAQGWSASQAGLLLAFFSLVQIPSALLGPVLAERRRRWRFWTAVALICTLAGTLGTLLLPMPPLVGPWAWITLIGIGVGAGFPLGLAVIAWRSPDGTATAATSGFALGIGYIGAGLGPLAMGLLIDLTGGYLAAIAVLIGAVALQSVAAARIGDR